MCFDLDSRPPIAPIAGAAIDSRELTLTSADGAPFAGFHARAAAPTGTGIVIVPDVRGLHPYYEDLALRFAEHGVDAVAFDFFGRTAGVGRRGAGFDFMPHVERTTFDGLRADLVAAAEWLRSAEERRVRRLFVVGFCFGGRLAFVSGALGLDLDGVIGFYGRPVGEGRSGVPAPASLAARMSAPVLGLFGGADPSISDGDVAEFEQALTAAAVPHRLVVYPGAPHSFFDRKADEYAETSRKAWDEVIRFVRDPEGATASGDRA